MRLTSIIRILTPSLLTLVFFLGFSGITKSQDVKIAKKPKYNRAKIYTTFSDKRLNTYIWEVTDSTLVLLNIPPDKCVYKIHGKDSLIYTEEFHSNLYEIPFSRIKRINISVGNSYAKHYLMNFLILLGISASQGGLSEGDMVPAWLVTIPAVAIGSLFTASITKSIFGSNRVNFQNLSYSEIQSRLIKYKCNPLEFGKEVYHLNQ